MVDKRTGPEKFKAIYDSFMQRQKEKQKQVEEVQAENKILKGTLPLMIRFMQSTDPKEKAEISRELLELGYMPKT